MDKQVKAEAVIVPSVRALEALSLLFQVGAALSEALQLASKRMEEFNSNYGSLMEDVKLGRAVQEALKRGKVDTERLKRLQSRMPPDCDDAARILWAINNVKEVL